MAADLLPMAFNSVLDLLRAAALTTLPAFVLALAINALRKALVHRYQWTWMKSAFVATFLVFAVLVNLVYWPDWLSTVGQAAYGQLPPEIQPTAASNALGYAFNEARLLFVALLLTLLAFPVELVTLYFKEHAERRHGVKGLLAALAGVFMASFLAWAAILFLFPWAVSGVLYLIFFGFGPGP